jgi:hypothetical protein
MAGSSNRLDASTADGLSAAELRPENGAFGNFPPRRYPLIGSNAKDFFLMNGVSSLGPQVAKEALRILENTQQTRYQHDIYIDEATGTYDVDCSGFVSYILGLVAPYHLDLIPRSGAETRLLAHDYFKFLSRLLKETVDGWQPIPHLASAQPGDLIAWALPRVGHGDTGHVFVVVERPVAIGTDTMAVMAYDASDILHYDDSRGPGLDQFRTGVGSGTFHLRVNRAGRPIAFQFGPGDPIVTDNIAIGRIERFDD